ncbi:MAG: hypothetical protein WC891_03395 [Actinomycetota bacterium]
MVMLAMLLLQSSADQAASDAAASALCGGFGLIYLVCWGLVALIAIALFVFWILMLIDCFQRDESEFPNSTGNSKTIWLVVLLASWLLSMSWLAALIYYFMVKRAMPRGQSKPPAPPEAPAA